MDSVFIKWLLQLVIIAILVFIIEYKLCKGYFEIKKYLKSLSIALLGAISYQIIKIYL